MCKCGEDSRPGQRDCKTCHAAYMRNWRKTHKMTLEQRKKDNARSYARMYLLRGKLLQQPCEVCEDPNTEMHHDDYDKPLEVRWLCRECHLDHHYDR